MGVIITENEKSKIFDTLQEKKFFIRKGKKKIPASFSGRLQQFPTVYNDEAGIAVQITWQLAKRVAEGETDFVEY